MILAGDLKKRKPLFVKGALRAEKKIRGIFSAEI